MCFCSNHSCWIGRNLIQCATSCPEDIIVFTIAGDASASDNRASPFYAGVGAIAATASTAAAKRNIRPMFVGRQAADGFASCALLAAGNRYSSVPLRGGFEMLLSSARILLEIPGSA